MAWGLSDGLGSFAGGVLSVGGWFVSFTILTILYGLMFNVDMMK